MLPVGVIAQAAGVAAFPFLARLVAEGRGAEMRESMGRTIRTVLFASAGRWRPRWRSACPPSGSPSSTEPSARTARCWWPRPWWGTRSVFRRGASTSCSPAASTPTARCGSRSSPGRRGSARHTPVLPRVPGRGVPGIAVAASITVTGHALTLWLLWRRVHGGEGLERMVRAVGQVALGALGRRRGRLAGVHGDNRGAGAGHVDRGAGDAGRRSGGGGGLPGHYVRDRLRRGALGRAAPLIRVPAAGRAGDRGDSSRPWSSWRSAAPGRACRCGVPRPGVLEHGGDHRRLVRSGGVTLDAELHPGAIGRSVFGHVGSSTSSTSVWFPPFGCTKAIRVPRPPFGGSRPPGGRPPPSGGPGPPRCPPPRTPRDAFPRPGAPGSAHRSVGVQGFQ